MSDNKVESEARRPGSKNSGELPLLCAREVELLNGMIQVQLNHAVRCGTIANQKMAVKQEGWDMERVELLKKLIEQGT